MCNISRFGLCPELKHNMHCLFSDDMITRQTLPLHWEAQQLSAIQLNLDMTTVRLKVAITNMETIEEHACMCITMYGWLGETLLTCTEEEFKALDINLQ